MGGLIRARRKELGLTQQQVTDLGGPSPALQRQIENGHYAANMQLGARRGYEDALGWVPHTIADLLFDPEKVPELREDKAGYQPPVGTTQVEILDGVEKAQAAFDQAVAEMVRAEAELDTQMRRWARYYAKSEALEREVERRGMTLIRPLTEQEIDAEQELPNPTPAEIAEVIAWSAMHDPREWTRYEMALVEFVFEFSDGMDVRDGSSYASLEKAREWVRRANPRKSSELDATDIPADKPEGGDESGGDSPATRNKRTYPQPVTEVAREDASQPDT